MAMPAWAGIEGWRAVATMIGTGFRRHDERGEVGAANFEKSTSIQRNLKPRS